MPPGVQWVNPDVQYTYDGLDRLKEAKRGLRTTTPFATLAGSQQWALDMLGNWVTVKKELTGNSPTYGDSGQTEDRTHNQANEIANRYASASGNSPTLPFVYDAAGNLRDAGRNLTITDRYDHDAWNRLVAHKMSNGGPYALNAEYQYNGLHWRTVAPLNEVGVQVSQERVMYYSAAWQLLEERIDDDIDNDPGEDRVAQEFWGIRYIDDPVLRRVYPSGQPTDDARYYHLTDAQFSTVATIDAGSGGALVERVRYDPYGKATHRWPSDFDDSGSVSSNNDLRAINGLSQEQVHRNEEGT